MAEKDIKLPEGISPYTFNRVRELNGEMGFQLKKAQRRPALHLVGRDDVVGEVENVDDGTLPFSLEGTIFSDDNLA